MTAIVSLLSAGSSMELCPVLCPARAMKRKPMPIVPTNKMNAMLLETKALTTHFLRSLFCLYRRAVDPFRFTVFTKKVL
ncbi:MAG: hypothetical protein ACXVOI_00130 [Tumebacillaceae bacterium]